MSVGNQSETTIYRDAVKPFQKRQSMSTEDEIEISDELIQLSFHGPKEQSSNALNDFSDQTAYHDDRGGRHQHKMKQNERYRNEQYDEPNDPHYCNADQWVDQLI